MSRLEWTARWVVAALVVGVLPLIAWSGGCSSSVTTPDSGRGGSGGTGGAAGDSGTRGAAGTASDDGGNEGDAAGVGGGAGSNDGSADSASGGAGGTNSSDGGVQCCSGPSRRCTDDRRQLQVCDFGSGCSSSATYSFVMKPLD